MKIFIMCILISVFFMGGVRFAIVRFAKCSLKYLLFIIYYSVIIY